MISLSDLRRERAVGALDHARPHLGGLPPPLPRAFRFRGVIDVGAISVDGRRQLRVGTGTGFSTFSTNLAFPICHAHVNLNCVQDLYDTTGWFIRIVQRKQPKSFS